MPGFRAFVSVRDTSPHQSPVRFKGSAPNSGDIRDDGKIGASRNESIVSCHATRNRRLKDGPVYRVEAQNRIGMDGKVRYCAEKGFDPPNMRERLKVICCGN